MAIGHEEKKAIVAEVNETAASALSLVIADARGVASNDMTALRASARENQITLRVVRNTLAKRALEGTEYECVTDTLTGPSLFGFSMEDPGAAARLFKDFASAYCFALMLVRFSLPNMCCPLGFYLLQFKYRFPLQC